MRPLQRLRLRLTLVCTAMTAIILACVTWGAYHVARDLQEQSGHSAFQSDYSFIVHHVSTQTVLDQAWIAQTENANHLMVYIENNGEALLFPGSWETPTSREVLVGAAREYALELGLRIDTPPSSAANDECIFFFLYGSHGERYRAAVASIPLSRGALRGWTGPMRGWMGIILLKDMREEDAVLFKLAAVFILLTLAGTLLLAVFSFWFAGRAIRPIEESQRRQTQFVAAASHELRSPLAVIEASASAAADGGVQSGRFLAAIGRECRRMSRLVDDLLLLARADAGSWTLRCEEVDVETLVLSQSEVFEGVAAEKKISVTAGFDGDEALPPVYGDPQRLGQVLAILLDNAVSYTPAGGRIHVHAGGEGGSVRLSVADTGPGIGEGDMRHIFERFYRADSARSAKDHYGLGLSIAQEIVSLHGGEIAVKNNPGGAGCTFTVELPAGTARLSGR